MRLQRYFKMQKEERKTILFWFSVYMFFFKRKQRFDDEKESGLTFKETKQPFFTFVFFGFFSF